METNRAEAVMLKPYENGGTVGVDSSSASLLVCDYDNSHADDEGLGESIRLDQTELHELTGTELQVPKCAESEVKTKGKTRASTPPTTNEAELRATRHDSVGQEAKYKKIIQASTPPRFDATKPNDCQRQSRTHDASNPEDANQSGVNVIATDDQPMTAGADGIAAEDCRVNLGSNCPHIAPEQKDVYAAHRTTEASKKVYPKNNFKNRLSTTTTKVCPKKNLKNTSSSSNNNKISTQKRFPKSTFSHTTCVKAISLALREKIERSLKSVIEMKNQSEKNMSLGVNKGFDRQSSGLHRSASIINVPNKRNMKPVYNPRNKLKITRSVSHPSPRVNPKAIPISTAKVRPSRNGTIKKPIADLNLTSRGSCYDKGTGNSCACGAPGCPGQGCSCSRPQRIEMSGRGSKSVASTSVHNMVVHISKIKENLQPNEKPKSISNFGQVERGRLSNKSQISISNQRVEASYDPSYAHVISKEKPRISNSGRRASKLKVPPRESNSRRVSTPNMRIKATTQPAIKPKLKPDTRGNPHNRIVCTCGAPGCSGRGCTCRGSKPKQGPKEHSRPRASLSTMRWKPNRAPHLQKQRKSTDTRNHRPRTSSTYMRNRASTGSTKQKEEKPTGAFTPRDSQGHVITISQMNFAVSRDSIRSSIHSEVELVSTSYRASAPQPPPRPDTRQKLKGADIVKQKRESDKSNKSDKSEKNYKCRCTADNCPFINNKYESYNSQNVSKRPSKCENSSISTDSGPSRKQSINNLQDVWTGFGRDSMSISVASSIPSYERTGCTRHSNNMNNIATICLCRDPMCPGHGCTACPGPHVQCMACNDTICCIPAYPLDPWCSCCQPQSWPLPCAYGGEYPPQPTKWPAQPPCLWSTIHKKLERVKSPRSYHKINYRRKSEEKSRDAPRASTSSQKNTGPNFTHLTPKLTSRRRPSHKGKTAESQCVLNKPDMAPIWKYNDEPNANYQCYYSNVQSSNRPVAEPQYKARNSVSSNKSMTRGSNGSAKELCPCASINDVTVPNNRNSQNFASRKSDPEPVCACGHKYCSGGSCTFSEPKANLCSEQPFFTLESKPLDYKEARNSRPSAVLKMTEKRESKKSAENCTSSDINANTKCCANSHSHSHWKGESLSAFCNWQRRKIVPCSKQLTKSYKGKAESRYCAGTPLDFPESHASPNFGACDVSANANGKDEFRILNDKLNCAVDNYAAANYPCLLNVNDTNIDDRLTCNCFIKNSTQNECAVDKSNHGSCNSSTQSDNNAHGSCGCANPVENLNIKQPSPRDSTPNCQDKCEAHNTTNLSKSGSLVNIHAICNCIRESKDKNQMEEPSKCYMDSKYTPPNIDMHTSANCSSTKSTKSKEKKSPKESSECLKDTTCSLKKKEYRCIANSKSSKCCCVESKGKRSSKETSKTQKSTACAPQNINESNVDIGVELTKRDSAKEMNDPDNCNCAESITKKPTDQTSQNSSGKIPKDEFVKKYCNTSFINQLKSAMCKNCSCAKIEGNFLMQPFVPKSNSSTPPTPTTPEDTSSCKSEKDQIICDCSGRILSESECNCKGSKTTRFRLPCKPNSSQHSPVDSISTSSPLVPETEENKPGDQIQQTSTSSQCGRSQSPPPVKPKPATGSRAGRCRLSVTKDLCSKCPSLKPFVKNEHLDCTSLEHFVANTHNRQKEQDKQVLGLAMVVQHISDELLKTNKACNKKPKTDYSSECPYTLEQATELLKDAQRKCEELRGQVHEKEADWMKDEKEMEHMFNCEMQKVLESHEKERLMTIERFRELEARVQQKEEESEQCLQTYRAEMARKLTHKQEQLKAAEEQVHKLQSCLQQAEAQEQQLREKCQCLENSNASNMAIANHREQELSDRIKVLTKELNTMRTNMEFNERDLRDRLALSQDEVSVLRKTRHCPNESKNAPTDAEVCRLTSEADSLRCVLELKQSEISTLTKKNAELKRENDERMNIMNKLTLLEAQNEMIRTELEAKCEKEKEYVRQIEEIQKAHTHDNYKCQRLSLDNEVLQYTLKHRSEQLQLVEAKLAELSSDNSHNFTHNRSSLGNNCSSRCGNHTSPPVSPIVKGVIEKNDSVSWVLEMDDETPQVAASKMVRRAGSLRCSSERSPTQRRQLSVSAGNSLCCNGSPTAAHGASSGAAAGPNPLSQSMSATSVIRTHSNESESRPHSRARSLSVCSKGTCDGCEKHKYARKSARRQRSGGDLQVPDWNEEAMRTSSPNHEIMRPRSSTIKLASPPQSRSELFSRASKASTLITCDSSSLTSGERLDMHSAYPSALKKKFHEIQESAGEAMVSGTNSEDESCSASSEDMGSSSSSTASAGQQLQKQQPPSRLFIEEALLLERANSLNGTPMEVSWSEDAVDATESVYSNGA
ncbi:uncharacterized protein LOC115628493 isoform X3 [Scaptodrosophila lebanonensis]|uniref:Uncharacterized protein LOC115628493 isoform X3 n=1 Tax=Drosophila lebanonensis TaxID=7225 RepID=A0A6J2TZ75_DROLE|nr:uncharacterized protein LOC115628493 isoform X3 [Scaptodrosophila lebanonensis]